MNVGMEVKQKGPLFKRNSPKQIKLALKATLKELVQDGEGFLMNILRPRPNGVYLDLPPSKGGSTGNYRRNISSIIRHKYAEINDGGVVYGPWLEGISSRNQTTKFKGYKAFRMATAEIQLKAEKTLEKHTLRMTKKLGGKRR